MPDELTLTASETIACTCREQAARLHEAIRAGDHATASEVLDADSSTAYIKECQGHYAVHMACQKVAPVCCQRQDAMIQRHPTWQPCHLQMSICRCLIEFGQPEQRLSVLADFLPCWLTTNHISALSCTLHISLDAWTLSAKLQAHAQNSYSL